MKRFCILICICLLLGTLTACHMEDKPEVSVSVVATEDATQPTETSTEREATMMPSDDQIERIVQELEQWLPEEEWYYQPYSYAITDLNHNGRLELLVSICEGTGIYTTTDVYEVSEDGESLIRCENSMGEGASQVDLIVGKAPVYYNEESETYTFLFSDFMRSGWEWNGEEVRAIALIDGVLTETLIAGVSNEYDLEENCTTTYYNAVGEIIDETAYNAAVEEYFADCVEMEALFAWQMYGYDEAIAMDADAWELALQSSYAGFSVS